MVREEVAPTDIAEVAVRWTAISVAQLFIKSIRRMPDAHNAALASPQLQDVA